MSGLPPGPLQPGPSLANFTTWVRNVMGVGAGYLPDAAPALNFAFAQALSIVNRDLAVACGQPGYFSPYELAVYNLGGHLLIEFAADAVYPIAAVTWDSGQALVTTQAANTIAPGDQIVVGGISPNGYNTPPGKTWIVNSILSPTQFGYLLYPNPGPATIPGAATVTEWYFANARQQARIAALTTGLVANAGDVSTSAGLVVPEFAKNLTLFDLQLTKTVYGRTYLSIAQKYGPSIWGLT